MREAANILQFCFLMLLSLKRTWKFDAKLFSIHLLVISIALQSFSKGRIVVKQHYADGNPKIAVAFTNLKDSTEYTCIAYFDNGKIDSEVDYKNGIQEGYFRSFYKNGNKKQECFIRNGKKHGLLKTWYENGQPKSEGNYTNGIQDGTWKVWTDKNTLFVKTVRQGKEDGRIIEYLTNKNGVMKIVMTKNRDNKQEGVWRLYDIENNLVQTTIFYNGVLNGDFMEYFPNGKIKATGKLLNGFYEGVVRYYDVFGYVTKLKKYRRGSVVAEY